MKIFLSKHIVNLHIWSKLLSYFITSCVNLQIFCPIFLVYHCLHPWQETSSCLSLLLWSHQPIINLAPLVLPWRSLHPAAKPKIYYCRYPGRCSYCSSQLFSIKDKRLSRYWLCAWIPTPHVVLHVWCAQLLFLHPLIWLLPFVNFRWSFSLKSNFGTHLVPQHRFEG